VLHRFGFGATQYAITIRGGNAVGWTSTAASDNVMINDIRIRMYGWLKRSSLIAIASHSADLSLTGD
jgi:hypothetical protein